MKFHIVLLRKLSYNISRDHPILNLATVIFPHSSPVLLLLIKLHLLVSVNFVFAVNEVILNKKLWIIFVWIYYHEFSWFLIKYLLWSLTGELFVALKQHLSFQSQSDPSISPSKTCLLLSILRIPPKIQSLFTLLS